jgi:hypothetical protein
MIIDRQHRPWIYATLGLALGGALLYAAGLVFSAAPPRGGTALGLSFGFAGTALIVFECLLSLRKKFPASPFGQAKTWMKGHIWLGFLSFLLILFHSGWHWGRGIAGLLMWIFLFITLSGLLGLALQHYLPRRLTELVPRETVYEQIPLVIRELRVEADERVEHVTADLGILEEPEAEPVGTFHAGGVKFHFDPEQRKSAQKKIDEEAGRRKSTPQIQVDPEFSEALRIQYVEEIRPFLQRRPSAEERTLFHNATAVAAYFKRLRTIMPVPTHEVLADLEEIVEERRQLAIQERMHLWLHAWLLLHVPLSMAFLVLIAAHAIMTLRY